MRSREATTTMQDQTVETNIVETTVAADNKPKPTPKRRRRSKAAGRAHNAALGITPLVYSIAETCAAIGISERTYYNMPESERPKKIEIGDRVLHPVEAIQEWLRARAK